MCAKHLGMLLLKLFLLHVVYALCFCFHSPERVVCFFAFFFFLHSLPICEKLSFSSIFLGLGSSPCLKSVKFRPC